MFWFMEFSLHEAKPHVRVQASNSQNDGSSNLAYKLGLHRFWGGALQEASVEGR